MVESTDFNGYNAMRDGGGILGAVSRVTGDNRNEEDATNDRLATEAMGRGDPTFTDFNGNTRDTESYSRDSRGWSPGIFDEYGMPGMALGMGVGAATRAGALANDVYNNGLTMSEALAAQVGGPDTGYQPGAASENNDITTTDTMAGPDAYGTGTNYGGRDSETLGTGTGWTAPGGPEDGQAYANAYGGVNYGVGAGTLSQSAADAEVASAEANSAAAGNQIASTNSFVDMIGGNSQLADSKNGTWNADRDANGRDANGRGLGIGPAPETIGGGSFYSPMNDAESSAYWQGKTGVGEYAGFTQPDGQQLGEWGKGYGWQGNLMDGYFANDAPDNPLGNNYDTSYGDSYVGGYGSDDATAAYGANAGVVGGPDVSAATIGYSDDGIGGDGDSGGDSSVICTELHRQGLIPTEWFKADIDAGLKFMQNDPDVIRGYHTWGKPIARLMKKSKTITFLAKQLALPWAREMYIQEGNNGFSTLRGKFLIWAGVPMCRMIGRLTRKSGVTAYRVGGTTI